MASLSLAGFDIHEAAMLADALIHATGLFALTLNVSGVVRPNDRTLRHMTGWAAALWAVNNVLIGAYTAAALSVLTVARQSAAAALHGRRDFCAPLLSP